MFIHLRSFSRNTLNPNHTAIVMEILYIFAAGFKFDGLTGFWRERHTVELLNRFSSTGGIKSHLCLGVK